VDNTFYQLWFAVRYVHVASVALLTGGAVMLCALCVGSRRETHGGSSIVVAAPIYEWMFWSLVGITVVTGVSNLGLKGDGLMAPETIWGRALTMKVTAALVLLALSLFRTDVVIRSSAAVGLGVSDRLRIVLGALYGLTVVILLGVVWIGLGLAHGRY
jgi:hypothetical protein